MTLFNGTSTILIIDDTPSNLGVVVTLFESNGYRIAIAQDGEEGLQRAQLVRPDLILLDVMMPGIDGFETCRRLKAMGETRDIPVIFMTSLVSVEHKVKGFQAGGVDYLTKPLQIDEVMARVGTHLKLHAAQKRLEEQNAQLQRYREQLEQRVIERTIELSMTNKRLRAEIQERKQTQQELAAREREFRTLVENAPDDIVRYDRQCRYSYINSRHEKTLGISACDIVGKTPMECFTGSPDAAAYQELMMKVIETVQPADYESILPDAGDGPHYHIVRLVAERGADGEVVGVLALGRDITERKRAEQQIAIKGAALAQMHEAAYFVDDQARIFYVNAEATRQLGYSREELLGMKVMDIHTPGWTAEMVVNAWQRLGEGGASTFESEHRRKDGGIIPVEISITHLKHDGKAFALAIVRDITERKRAEEALAAREREFRTLVENHPDGIIRLDTEGRHLFVNDAALRSAGLVEMELLGKTVCELPLPGNPESMRPLFDAHRRVMDSGKLDVMEFTWPNGRVSEIRHIPEFDGQNEMVSVLAIARDITERKRAEQVLHAQAQAIRTVVENSPDTVIRYDSQCRRIYLNPSMEKIFGLPKERLLGTSPSEFSPLPPTYVEKIESVLASGQEQRMETSFRDTEGRARWVDLRMAPEFDSNGKVVSVLAIGRDITARKQAEVTLKESEQRYREIFDNAVEGIYLLEVTEDGRFRNIDINPTLAASTGIPREAMIGQFVDDTVSEDTGKLVVEKYRRCVAAGKTITENIELDLPAGKRYFLSTITPIYYGGRVHRLIGISRDISVLKQAERELHDELGQVLTGLQLNISVLEHKFVPGLPPLHEHLQETKVLTDRALAVARNVASALRPAALDLGINSALEWLTGRFSTNTGIQCKVHISEDEIYIDESHAIALFRIVQESLTNVSRHAKASRVDVSFGKEGDDYLLSVCDNGKGFETDTKKLDSYGLVGIKERTLLLGGTVIIESKPGKGTQISVRIPLNHAEEE